MFILAVVFAVLIGYILRGRLKNLESVNIYGLYLAFAGFLIEFVIIISITRGILQIGYVTFILNLIMYILLFLFTYLNRKNPFILLMGLGFLLNAIAIFFNGGAMPVSLEAVKKVGITSNVSTEGLYVLINGNTRLGFLGDIIPFQFITRVVISIGDSLSAIGLMLFIITGMKAYSIKRNSEVSDSISN